MKTKKSNDLLHDVYGPGNDNYGKDKPFWKKDLNEIVLDSKGGFSADEEMENCVSCGKETEYTVNTDINFRYYYVEGAGQLCKECYDKIYKISFLKR